MTHYPAKSQTSPESGPSAASWLRTLDEIEGADLPLVGGKAFRLAMLKQHGLHVPPGLALTTAFFEAQLQHAQLVPLWAGSPDVAVTAEALIWLAEMLKTRPLAKELSSALHQALDELFGQDVAGQFAVRSSAIDEDQRDHTFAGIHLTELGVPRSVLPIAITRCWASALDRPAIEYRQVHGMSIQSIRTAVLIQPMLNSQSSGVGFTINPLTGARDEFVIEATWGLGDALVSGEVQPYFYKLSNQPPDYPIIEQRAGNVKAHGEARATSPLSAAALAELAIQLEQVQVLMGEPQDVEWARQDDSFYLLQTRPITAIPEALPSVDVEWTRGSHPEFLPELPSPLTNSILERAENRIIASFKELDLQVEELGPYIKLILGRPYLNLTLLKRVISQVGLNSSHLLHTIGYTESSGLGGTLSIDWATAWQKRRAYWLILRRLLSNKRELRVYKALVDEATTLLADLNLDAPLPTLLAQLRHHERVYSDFFAANLGIALGLSALTAISASLIAPLTQTPATFISSLASKGLKTIDSRLSEALLNLGQLAQRQPQTQKFLEAVAADKPGPTRPAEFIAAFDDLLGQYGQRATYELDLGWPRYQDDPRPLLIIVRRYAQSDATPDPARTGKTETTWGQLISQSRGLQRWLPWRCGLAALLVKLLRRLLLRRDELNSDKARAVAACRRWDLALGQKWVEQGWLAQPADIFWLTIEEIERALMIEAEAVILSSNVQARKETYETYAATRMPFRLNESRIPFIQLGVGLSAAIMSDVLVGLPISPGQVRGTILVLRHPDEFEKIADDIILVTPSTDPAWLPLLHLASGLIVEMGGLLSHGSVIAREYGLPAVANIVNATQIFHTGDSVLVDGSTGIVQVLEPAQGL
jgi:pyruvate,water dikinase